MRGTLLSTGVFLTLTLTGASFAQPSSDTRYQGTPSSQAPKPGSDGKSRELAYGLAFGGTLAPIFLGTLLANKNEDSRFATILILGGLSIGPSTGQFYAQSVGRGLVATLIRTVGTGLFINGATTTHGGTFAYDDERIKWGTVLVLGGTIYSIIDTRRALDRYEQRARTATYGLAPTLTAAPGDGLRPGLMAFSRF